jgi:hypothetical protein
MDCDNYRVSKLLQKYVKCKIYTTVISTAVIYGSQSWTITNTDEGKLSISEKKILRKIYGPSFVNGLWRIKNSDELYSLCKELSIKKMIKTDRLKWLGCIARMENNVPVM